MSFYVHIYLRVCVCEWEEELVCMYMLWIFFMLELILKDIWISYVICLILLSAFFCSEKVVLYPTAVKCCLSWTNCSCKLIAYKVDYYTCIHFFLHTVQFTSFTVSFFFCLCIFHALKTCPSANIFKHLG